MANKKLLGILILSGVLIIGTIYYYIASGYTSTDNARVKMANIQIASEVSGYVKKVNAHDNQIVKAEDVIIEINEEKYQIAYDEEKANFSYYAGEYERQSQLIKNHFISASDLSKTAHALESSKEKLAKAKYDLDKTKITAQNNGVLTNFDIKIGDFITKERPIFNIINKGDVWIEANFKEGDISGVSIGQPAEIEIDTFKGIKWHAKVTSIAPATGSEFSLLPAQNSSGNWIKVAQRVAVRLEFDKGQDLSNLASGMSAFVKIKIKK